MGRGLTVWGSAFVLAVVGTQLAHAVGYRLVAPDHARRELLMSETGHGYLSYGPLALAIGFALLTVMLVTEVRLAVRRTGSSPCAWGFLLVAPVVFVVQEHLERLVHDGAFPFDTVLEGTFQLGLALQVPFALAAYAVARLLLSAARELGQLLGAPQRPRRLVPPCSAAPRLDVRPPRVAALALGYGERGPPVHA